MRKTSAERKMDALENGEYGLCNVAASIAGNVVSAVIGGNAAESAAQTQANAANNASANTMAMFNTENANLQPFTSLGSGSIPSLISAMGYNGTYGANGQLTGMTQNPNSPLNQTFSYQPFSFNPSDLQNYPGYQFALQQGLLGVNNSAAARGLGTSAADVKNAAGYASGLASETYGQAYNQQLGAYQTNYNTAANNFQTNYNAAANNAARVAGLVQTGQNSAAMQANAGLASAQNAGNFSTSAGAALAAGQVGAANALTNAIGGGTNAALMNNYVNNMTNNQNGGGWGTPAYGDVNSFNSGGTNLANIYGNMQAGDASGGLSF